MHFISPSLLVVFPVSLLVDRFENCHSTRERVSQHAVLHVNSNGDCITNFTKYWLHRKLLYQFETKRIRIVVMWNRRCQGLRKVPSVLMWDYPPSIQRWIYIFLIATSSAGKREWNRPSFLESKLSNDMQRIDMSYLFKNSVQQRLSKKSISTRTCRVLIAIP